MNDASCRFCIGQRVEVYWKDELEWFSGRVTQVDGNSTHCFVEYDDGDEAWETVDTMRPQKLLNEDLENTADYFDDYAEETLENYAEETFENNAEETFENYASDEELYADDTFEETSPLRKLMSPKRKSNVITSRPYNHAFRYHPALSLIAKNSYITAPGVKVIGSKVSPRPYSPVCVHSFMECESVNTQDGKVEVQTQTYKEKY